MRSLIGMLIVISAACAGCGSEAESSIPRPSAEALISAAASGDLATVERLLGSGADVDSRDGNGQTAVTAAAIGEHAAVVRALIDAGADVDLQDDTDNNPLLVCGETGNVGVLREVLRADPDLTRTNRFGGTALIPAADRGHVEMVRALVTTDIPIDHVNRLGWTALLEAVVLGDGGAAHEEIVRLLVDAGADPTIADRDGVSAFEHARRRGFAGIERILGQAMEDPRWS